MIYKLTYSRLERKILRAGVIFGMTFFAFAGEVYATPTLLPASAVQVTTTSAMLRGYTQGYEADTIVWFEWNEASSVSAPTVVGMHSVKDSFTGGYFDARLEQLTPGTTYSFRAFARGGGTTVPSAISTFTTLSSKPAPVNVEPATTQTPVSNTARTKTQTVQTVAVKKATVATAPKKEGFTNGNSATVIGAESNLLPTTLIGWVGLLIAIFVAILLGHMIYEAPEKRKRALEEEKQRARRESM